MNVTLVYANALQIKCEWPEHFKEIIEAIVTSFVFVGVMVLISAFSEPRAGKELAGSIGIVAGFGWESAFHMAQHALHFETISANLGFYLMQVGLLLPALLWNISDSLVKLEKAA